jgi:hypothetical protein
MIISYFVRVPRLLATMSRADISVLHSIQVLHLYP